MLSKREQLWRKWRESLAARRPPDGGARFEGRRLVVAPHASARGTQTLTWAPAAELTGVQAVSALHSLPLGQAFAQNESPLNCPHTSPVVQSDS